eukprot:scaffold239240_cov26-Prasinocladus_malaysianus.AAC.1
MTQKCPFKIGNAVTHKQSCDEQLWVTVADERRSFAIHVPKDQLAYISSPHRDVDVHSQAAVLHVAVAGPDVPQQLLEGLHKRRGLLAAPH